MVRRFLKTTFQAAAIAATVLFLVTPAFGCLNTFGPPSVLELLNDLIGCVLVFALFAFMVWVTVKSCWRQLRSSRSEVSVGKKIFAVVKLFVLVPLYSLFMAAAVVHFDDNFHPLEKYYAIGADILIVWAISQLLLLFMLGRRIEPWFLNRPVQAAS